MTPAAVILRAEIAMSGPIPFSRFMEVALYHPEHGYYIRARDPFGKAGDYYTAEQVQPVFGILIRNVLRALQAELGDPAGFTVVELGAGRGEMSEALSAFHYVPVDVGRGTMPELFTGVVFSNEFFDALPVNVYARTGEGWVERRVAWTGDRFTWVDADRAEGDAAAYLDRYMPGTLDPGSVVEVNLAALDWLGRIALSLERGFVFTVDYGYTARELVRFPRGTLMSYREHHAIDDVLRDPGLQDITAHVSFTALEEQGRGVGLTTVRRETLARTLLRAGEADQFASVLGAATPAEELRRRMQLKTLLFGMGETFQTLLQRKETASK